MPLLLRSKEYKYNKDCVAVAKMILDYRILPLSIMVQTKLKEQTKEPLFQKVENRNISAIDVLTENDQSQLEEILKEYCGLLQSPATLDDILKRNINFQSYENLKQTSQDVLKNAALSGEEKALVAVKFIDLIKEDLFQNFIKLPALEELDIEEQKKYSVLAPDKFNSDKVYSVMERAYGVTGTKFSSEKYLYIGSQRLHSCISPVLHAEGKTIVPHVDSHTEIKSLQNMTEEFKKGEPFEIFTFGGLPDDEREGFSDAYQLSIANAKEIFYFIYKYANDTNTIVKAPYANIFKKTKLYREYHIKSEQNETIGFVFNHEGRVLLFKYAEFSYPIVYTAIPKNDALQRLSDHGYIWLQMRTHMEYKDFDIEKVTDFTDSNWVRADSIRRNNACFHAIINLVIKKLVSENFAAGITSLDQKLYDFLTGYIKNKNITSELDISNSYILHVLTYLTCEIYLNTEEHRLSFKISQEMKDAAKKLKETSLIHKLINDQEIVAWCCKQAKIEFIDFLGKQKINIDDNMLNSISEKHLLNDFVNYKLYLNKKDDENATVTNIDDGNFIFMVFNSSNKTEILGIIDDWVAKKTKKQILEHIVPLLEYNLDEVIESGINLVLIEEIMPFKYKLLPHLHPSYLNLDSLEWFAKEVNLLISNNKSCCRPFRPETLRPKFKEILNNWLKKPEFLPQMVRLFEDSEQGEEFALYSISMN